ncbi:hypothetical protein [Paludisphaera sp.]|uniref:hypothetical protein n=1 Tax=Paludisphaera sp. TaxID=2017432 RepID=UPI00301D9DF8
MQTEPDPRARAALGPRLIETAGRLRVEPGSFPIGWSAAWLALVAAVGLWGVGRSSDARGLTAMAAGMAFVIPALLAVLHGLNRVEAARGAFLDFDRSSGTIVAPRVGLAASIADVEAIRLRKGRWRDPDNRDGWGTIARIALAVRVGEEVSDVAILWNGHVREVEKLAQVVGVAIGRPLEVERRDWG